MEKFNLNEGNEALNRVLLMMKYNSTKTLTENVEDLEEQTTGQSGLSAGLATGGALAGAYAGAAIGTGGFPVVGTIIGGVLGAGIGLGAGALTDWATSGHKEKDDFENLMKFCTTSKSAKQIVRGVDNSEIIRITRKIEDSKGQWFDDEDSIVEALSSLKSISDLCAVNQKIKGGLLEFLNTVTNSPDEWRMFNRPIEDLVNNSKIILTPEQKKKVGDSTSERKSGKSLPLESGSYTTPGDPYQYKVVECIWYTKGKLITNWKSLKDNKKATDILDSRFPEARKNCASKKITPIPGQIPPSTITPQDKLKQQYGVTPQPNAQSEIQTTNDDINNY